MPSVIKARFMLLLAALCLAGLTLTANAQYRGPMQGYKMTVADILRKPVDDQDVLLQGYLVRQVAHDQYIFSDGTGEIVAEIKRKRFPIQPVDEKTRVELVGEVETKSRRPPEIEVDFVRVLP